MKNQRLKARLEQVKIKINQAVEQLDLNGVEYELGEWVTIKEYCERFNVESTNVVTNWIRRGVIPPDNVITIARLNDLRLIKAVPYK